jgi:hypothetical protein
MTTHKSIEGYVEDLVIKIHKGEDNERTYGTGQYLNPLSRRLIQESMHLYAQQQVQEAVVGSLDIKLNGALHAYGAWLLTDGKNAEPLERRYKKQEIIESITTTLRAELSKGEVGGNK